MRKLLTFLFAALAVSAGARHITPDEAATVASEFFNRSPRTRSAVSISPVMAKSASKADVLLYYAFNETHGNGFVLIAGDDRLPKVIGYSDKGSFNFENIPPQLSAIFESTEAALVQFDVSTCRHASWNASPTGNTSEKVLNTAEWNQDAPYNRECPQIDGKPTLAGCGAVALAIIMKYHNWPEKGVGRHRYKRNGEIIGYDFSKAQFDYSKMPDAVTAETSEEEKNAVADLIYAAGISVGTSYGVDASGYPAGMSYKALSYFFDYDPSCSYIEGDSHSVSELKDITISQIDKDLPVIYDGAPFGNGHTWVVDGYSEDKTMLHCNFGWGGEMNGFYAVDALLGYFRCDGIAIDIRPNRDHKPNVGIFMENDTKFFKPGIRVSTSDIVRGKKFELSAESICGIGLSDEIHSCIALVDETGDIKEVLYEKKDYYSENLDMPVPSFTLRFNVAELSVNACDVAFSDRIQLFAKRRDTDDWIPIPNSADILSSCGVSGLSSISNTFRFHISDKVDAELNKESPNHFLVNLTDGQEVSTLSYEGSVFISPKPDYYNHKVIFSVNGLKKGQMFHHWGRELSDYTIGLYNHELSSTLSFRNMTTDVFDVSIDYIKPGAPLHLVIQNPGTLCDMVTPEEAMTISDLSLSGSINAADIYYIANNFLILESLDLYDTDIEECEIESFPWYEGLLQPASHQKKDMWPDYGLIEMYHLKSVKLPKTLEAFGVWPLTYCYNLSYLEIPENVSRINHVGGDGATLWIGDNLKKIVSYNPIPPEVDEGVSIFNAGTTDETANNGILYVPAGSVEAYRSASGWRGFKEILPITQVASLEIRPQQIRLEEGTEQKLTIMIMPDEAIDKSVFWSSSDETVAMVDQNGTVTALKAGTATITAKTANGLKATCEVTVDEKSGIDGVETDAQISVTARDGVILVTAPEGTEVEVYSMIGQRVVKTHEHHIDRLVGGVYIVCVGGKTFKVIV